MYPHQHPTSSRSPNFSTISERSDEQEVLNGSEASSRPGSTTPSDLTRYATPFAGPQTGVSQNATTPMNIPIVTSSARHPLPVPPTATSFRYQVPRHTDGPSSQTSSNTSASTPTYTYSALPITTQAYHASNVPVLTRSTNHAQLASAPLRASTPTDAAYDPYRPTFSDVSDNQAYSGLLPFPKPNTPSIISQNYNASLFRPGTAGSIAFGASAATPAPPTQHYQAIPRQIAISRADAAQLQEIPLTRTNSSKRSAPRDWFASDSPIKKAVPEDLLAEARQRLLEEPHKYGIDPAKYSFDYHRDSRASPASLQSTESDARPISAEVSPTIFAESPQLAEFDLATGQSGSGGLRSGSLSKSDADDEKANWHFGAPPTDAHERRHKAKKRIALTHGNLVMELPISRQLSEWLFQRGDGEMATVR